MSNWILEFEKWVPHIKTVAYKGNPTARKALAHKVKSFSKNYNVLITTYDYVIRDKAVLAKVGTPCLCCMVKRSEHPI